MSKWKVVLVCVLVVFLSTIFMADGNADTISSSWVEIYEGNNTLYYDLSSGDSEGVYNFRCQTVCYVKGEGVFLITSKDSIWFLDGTQEKTQLVIPPMRGYGMLQAEGFVYGLLEEGEYVFLSHSK